MKTRNVVLGSLLIGAGVVLFARNFGWIDFSLAMVAPFWPILWILAGIMAWVDPQKRWLSGTTLSLILLSIPLMIYSKTLNWRSEWDFDNSDENEEVIMDLDDSKDRVQQTFTVEMPDTIRYASFHMTSGLGKFSVEESQKDLFHATLEGQHRKMKLTEGFENGVYAIDLSEPSGKEKQFKGDSDVILGFHTRPTWDMTWEIGLGEVDLDLRNFQVRQLELSTGLAEVNLVIGDQQKLTKIYLKSGMADTEIKIPEGAGGEIRTESALSSFDFEGFDKIEPGLYRTSNFKEASQKVFIDIESGFAAVQVKRYN